MDIVAVDRTNALCSRPAARSGTRRLGAQRTATSTFFRLSISRTTGTSPSAPGARLPLTIPARRISPQEPSASYTARPIFRNPRWRLQSSFRTPKPRIRRLMNGWRRGRDSNPWLFWRVTGFQDQLHKPLGHLSVQSDAHYNSIFTLACQQKMRILGERNPLADTKYHADRLGGRPGGPSAGRGGCRNSFLRFSTAFFEKRREEYRSSR